MMLNRDKQIMQEFDTYIFDLDGTLLDTLQDLAASTNYALRSSGLPERTLDEVRSFLGNGMRRLIELAVPGGESHPQFETVLDTFHQHYQQHSLDLTGPYPGVTDLLARLRQHGKRVAVVSNKFDSAVRDLMSHFFPGLVETAIGERAGIRRKPAPDTVEEALRQLGVGKEGAVYVGDSEVDYQTACNSGLPCISVLWGFRSKDFLMRHGATLFVSRPEEIYP